MAKRTIDPGGKRETAVRVARLLYEDGMSRNEIIDSGKLGTALKEIGVRKDYQLSKLVSWARTEGYFGLEVHAREWERGQKLEEALRMRFGLDAAVVVQVPASFPPPDETQGGALSESDDRLHHALGAAAANWLADGRIRRGDVVGIGGGRGAYYVAAGLRRIGLQRRVPPVRVAILTGRIAAEAWAPASLEGYVDAADAAWTLSRGLPDGAARPDAPTVDGARDDKHGVAHLRGLLEEGARDMSVALMGIGRLGARHTMIQLSRQDALPALHPLLAIREDVRRLVAIYDGEEVGDQHETMPPELFKSLSPLLPVYDMLNRVAACDPALFERPDRVEGLQGGAQATLDSMNGKIVSVGWAALAGVPLVLACAGGVSKLPAIASALQLRRDDSRTRLITALATDSLTADRLLRLGDRVAERAIPVVELQTASEGAGRSP
jgi:DNA-binding transcriptional regulator LsrR (DeoR family)